MKNHEAIITRHHPGSASVTPHGINRVHHGNNRAPRAHDGEPGGVDVEQKTLNGVEKGQSRRCEAPDGDEKPWDAGPEWRPDDQKRCNAVEEVHDGEEEGAGRWRAAFAGAACRRT